MITILDVKGEFAKLGLLRGRTPQMTEAERKASGAFATLALFRDGNIFSAPGSPATERGSAIGTATTGVDRRRLGNPVHDDGRRAEVLSGERRDGDHRAARDVASLQLAEWVEPHDRDGLILVQPGETDRARREALLHRIQQLIHDKVMYASLIEQAGLVTHGPRVAGAAVGLITNL